MNKRKEPTGISRGPQYLKSKVTLKQNRSSGNKDSELTILRRSEAESVIRVSPPRRPGAGKRARLIHLPCLFGKQNAPKVGKPWIAFRKDTL